jgi:two-component system response regulator AtoC
MSNVEFLSNCMSTTPLEPGAGRRYKLPPTHLIFGQSAVMSRLLEIVDRICRVPMPVLICGPTGTGKEVLANYIHQNSPWSLGRFVKVSCAAIPGTLLEAELFGFERGAFSGAYNSKPGQVEASHLGTLLLDDISELDPSLQAKLLQFLQDGTFTPIGGVDQRQVSCRLICTASDSLEQRVTQGRFREDLLHRISGISLRMPPLTERTEDLPAIADYLLKEFTTTFATRVPPLSSALLRRLLHHDWPGNIRELENVMRRYALLGTPKAVLEELNLRSRTSAPVYLIPDPADSSLKSRTKQLIQQAEAHAILQVLEEHDWNRSKSARSLNISLRGLLYKMRAAGITNCAPR